MGDATTLRHRLCGNPTCPDPSILRFVGFRCARLIRTARAPLVPTGRDERLEPDCTPGQSLSSGCERVERDDSVVVTSVPRSRPHDDPGNAALDSRRFSALRPAVTCTAASKRMRSIPAHPLPTRPAQLLFRPDQRFAYWRGRRNAAERRITRAAVPSTLLSDIAHRDHLTRRISRISVR